MRHYGPAVVQVAVRYEHMLYVQHLSGLLVYVGNNAQCGGGVGGRGRGGRSFRIHQIAVIVALGGEFGLQGP